MAAGQSAFSVATDVAALDACAEDLAAEELLRGAGHVRQLRALLRMEAVGRSSGMELGTVSHAALALGCSEHRAGRLLAEAVLLGGLPGALEAVECGLLTVEQSSTVVELLTPLPFTIRRTVWARLQQRLLGAGSALPPARLSELLRKWILAADPADATERRRQAEADRRLDYRRRADGLGDVFALGFTGPDLQAVLSRIRDRAHPVGPEDDRTADQRRFDAFKDLLLGRDPLPLDEPHDPPPPGQPCPRPGGGRAGCGCWPGSPVPCGAELLVHLTLDTGLGTSDEPAELVGHGPLEPDLLEQLLLASPRLRPVWTDEHGVPVAVGDEVVVPERGPGLGAGSAAAPGRAATSDRAAPPPPVRPPTRTATGTACCCRAWSRRRPGRTRTGFALTRGCRAPGRGCADRRRLRRPPCRNARSLPAASAAAPAPRRPQPAVRVARLRCAGGPVRRRARPALAGRADLRVQPRPVLPPAPPGQAARLDQDPPRE